MSREHARRIVVAALLLAASSACGPAPRAWSVDDDAMAPTLQVGDAFVVGPRLRYSLDSRAWGTVPLDDVLGVAVSRTLQAGCAGARADVVEPLQALGGG